jgi:hypothetical protein
LATWAPRDPQRYRESGMWVTSGRTVVRRFPPSEA